MKKLLFIRHPDMLIDEVKKLLQPFFQQVEQVIVFGSVARGDMGINSDLDIFIVGEDVSLKKKVMEKLEDLTIQTGIFYNLIFLGNDELELYASLYKTALKEGKVLWQKNA